MCERENVCVCVCVCVCEREREREREREIRRSREADILYVSTDISSHHHIYNYQETIQNIARIIFNMHAFVSPWFNEAINF